jgi:hypothetical protein
MEHFETGAVRDTGGKGRMDLLPMTALIRVSKHMEDALTHYPERNWEKGIPMHSMIDSAFRHLAKYTAGMTDEDHLCAATTNLLMALWTEENRPEMQDIPSRLNAVELEPVKSRPRGICDAFDAMRRACNGTKGRESCTCDGDPSRCDFYEDVRESAREDAEQG